MARKRSPHQWPFVRGIYLSSVDSFHKGPVMETFDISIIVILSVKVSMYILPCYFAVVFENFITFLDNFFVSTSFGIFDSVFHNISRAFKGWFIGLAVCWAWLWALTWLSNHMPSKVWNEITSTFHSQTSTVPPWVQECISKFIPHFIIL